MKILSARFAGSSTGTASRPVPRLPEFAFIGRSNVGKSSLINMLCASGALAKTSSTPGKTRLVNHFIINDSWYLVDLPGYGYAKISQKGRDDLWRMIGDYISNSMEMQVLFVLIDSRREIGSIDMDFLLRLGEAGIPFAIIFTKADKSGPVVLAERMEKCKEQILEHWESLPPIFVSSSEDGRGREEILSYIDSILTSK